MRKIIHNLRQQSEETRRHVLHVTITICAAVLVLLWIYSLATNLGNQDVSIKVKNDLQPLSTLKANLIGGYQSISGQNQ